MTMDSKYFVTSSFDKSVKITDLATFQEVYVFKDAASGSYLMWGF